VFSIYGRRYEDGYSPLNKHTLLDRFRAALGPTEIEVEGRNLVLHSFHHTYVTIIREVLPEKILREFTGHRTEAMTERYDHPALEHCLKSWPDSEISPRKFGNSSFRF